MIDSINLPYGLCEITFGDTEIKYLADAVEFNAIPVYEKLNYGLYQQTYLLKSYTVSLNVFLENETYQNIMLSYAGLHDDGNGGLYDNPSKFDLSGQILTIHPMKSGSSKEMDITIFSAIIDPENGYQRKYGKEKDSIKLRFLGQPAKSFNGDVFKSYFYIGDAVQAGVI